MEQLDELKQALAALDRRLDQQVAVRPGTTSRKAREDLRGSLRPLAIGQIVQAVVGLGFIALGVAAWRAGLGPLAGLFVSGVVLHVYGIAMIALAIAVRVLMARVDYSEPVLVIQRRLAEVRRVVVVSGYVLGLTWWVLWVPFAIAVVGAISGVDLSALNPPFAALLAGIGVVGFVITSLVHRWAKASGRRRLAAAFDAAFSGDRLRQANARIDEIARFEHD